MAAMTYRNDADALREQLTQLEARLATVRREREELAARTRDEPALVAELDRLRRTLHARAPRALPVLDDVRVASPCSARWDEMTGDEQVRFCGGCQKNVYNLSAMTRENAQALLVAREGKLCVRFYRRADGTLLTADCPVGVRRKRVRLAAAAGAVAALAAGAVAAAFTSSRPTMGGIAPSGPGPADPPTVVPIAPPQSTPPSLPPEQFMMGEPAFDPPPAASPPARPAPRHHRTRVR